MQGTSLLMCLCAIAMSTQGQQPMQKNTARVGRPKLLLLLALLTLCAYLWLASGGVSAWSKHSGSVVMVVDNAGRMNLGQAEARSGPSFRERALYLDRSMAVTEPHFDSTNLNEMAVAADHGSARAACMLSAALAICALEVDQESVEAEAVALAREDAGSSHQQQALVHLMRLERIRMFQESTCDSADRELLRQRAQRTLQAARRGSVASALRYFQNPPIMDKHGRLDIALASEYQKEGPIMLEQATASGSSTAAAELFQLLRSGSYATEHFVLQVPVDPVRAVAVGRVLVCCGDPWISRVLRDAVFSMEARLSVSERARAALLEEGFKKAKFTGNTEPQDALSEMQSCML